MTLETCLKPAPIPQSQEEIIENNIHNLSKKPRIDFVTNRTPEGDPVDLIHSNNIGAAGKRR